MNSIKYVLAVVAILANTASLIDVTYADVIDTVTPEVETDTTPTGITYIAPRPAPSDPSTIVPPGFNLAAQAAANPNVATEPAATTPVAVTTTTSVAPPPRAVTVPLGSVAVDPNLNVGPVMYGSTEPPANHGVALFNENTVSGSVANTGPQISSGGQVFGSSNSSSMISTISKTSLPPNISTALQMPYGPNSLITGITLTNKTQLTTTTGTSKNTTVTGNAMANSISSLF